MPAGTAFADTPAAPVKVPAYDHGDTAWMLTSTALVLMMTIPGLALFYAGMVRKKNILATVMQSFAITCLVTIVWTIVGLFAGLYQRHGCHLTLLGRHVALHAERDRRRIHQAG